jgi:succinate dehydrogenase / fumarate reductase cytochrome b subunit
MATTQTQSAALQSPPSTAAVSASIGKKVLMAGSGIVLILFVVGHMVGNLQLFMGPEQLNIYAEKLRDLGPLLWVIRGFLLAMLVIHVVVGIQLWLENRRARGQRYAKEDTVAATITSRTMIYTGLAIFFFVVYHLAHFTFFLTHPEYAGLHDAAGRHDVYSMVILGFQQPLISIAYILGMLFLSFHLAHAIFSVFQTLGFNRPSVQPKLRALARIVTVIVVAGYISMPLAVLTGIITLPPGVHL